MSWTGGPLPEFTIRFVRTQPLAGATWAREGHRFTDSNGYWDNDVEGGEVPTRITIGCWPKLDGTVSRENAPPSRGAIARDGRFEFRGLRPGEYQISAFGHPLLGNTRIQLTTGEQLVEIELVEQPRRR